MESTGKFERLFLEALRESMTSGAGTGSAFGDGPTMHTIYGPNAAAQNIDSGDTYAPGDARIPKVLGKGKVQTRKGATGGKKKKKKKKTDGLDGVFLTGEENEESYDEDAEKVDKDRMKCNSPRRTSGGSKKFVVKACKDGKEKIVRYGDPNMKIKKSNPKRRKSFRARHKCDQKKDKFSAGYWSCKKW
jgi:hypothetical protein